MAAKAALCVCRIGHFVSDNTNRKQAPFNKSEQKNGVNKGYALNDFPKHMANLSVKRAAASAQHRLLCFLHAVAMTLIATGNMPKCPWVGLIRKCAPTPVSAAGIVPEILHLLKKQA